MASKNKSDPSGGRSNTKRHKQQERKHHHRDKSFRHVFKGTVLVNTLLDYDGHKFTNRPKAIRFAQKLLDVGQIESITDGELFEDSMELYRWCDDSVVREAKQIENESSTPMTASHIPRRRIIELIDLHQADDTVDDSYTVEKTINKLTKPQQQPQNLQQQQQQSFDGNNNSSNHNVNNNNHPNIHYNKGLSSSSDYSDINSPRDRGGSSSNVYNNDGSRMSSASRDDSGGDCALFKGNSSSSSVLEYDPPDPHATWADQVLENRESFNEIEDDFERQSSYENDVFDQTATEPAKHGSYAYPQQNQHEYYSPENKPAEFKKSHNSSSSSTSVEGRSSSGGGLNSVVRYDGIDMPAIDLDNINFATMVGQLQDSTAQYSNMSELLDLTTEEGSSFSDNEKQLLQQMRNMQEDHQNTVDNYEQKITELMETISELKTLAQLLEAEKKNTENQKKVSTLTEETSNRKQEENSAAENEITKSAPTLTQSVPPPPVPPPPPPPLSSNGLLTVGRGGSLIIKPNKIPIKPRVKMRPLFWNRVILENDNDDHEETFWHYATEPNFDVDEFESLFGRDPAKEKKPNKSLHETISKQHTNNQNAASHDVTRKQQKQKVKLLDENRSRAVAIKLRSMHCEMDDIKNAIFKLDSSKLDVEKLHGLYEVKGTPEEMEKIKTYVEEHPQVSLDEPEEFLLEMSKMEQFSERIECLIFRKTLHESVFNIDQQLDIVQQACRAIKRNQAIRSVIELVLAFGNYMNGGTQRGQADGFDLEVLGKLKDVKSIDNSTTLLRHIVHVNTKESEGTDAGKNEASWRFPDVAIMTQASNISFKDVTAELNLLKTQIRSHSRKADIVCLNSKTHLLEPFKEQMDDFFESADTMLKGQFEKLETVQDMYNSLLQYHAVKDQSKMSTDHYFGIWAQFLEDFKVQWKLEQKHIAKQMFEKVETHRKERMRTAKRRKSIVEDGKSNLKQKFALMRQKKSESSIAHTVKLLRSQSMSGVDIVGEEDSEKNNKHSPNNEDSKVNHRQERITASAPVEKKMGRSRVRSRISEQQKINIQRSNSVSLLRNGESMIERMQQRRRTRVEKEEAGSTNASPVNISTTTSRKLNESNVKTPKQQMSRIGERLSQQSDIGMLGTTDTIKERMQRRRREREATSSVDSGTASPTPVSATTPFNNRPLDLASLRQRYGSSSSLIHTPESTVAESNNTHRYGKEVGSEKQNASNAVQDHKLCPADETGHTNCDHQICMAQKMTRSALRASSQEQLNVNHRTSVSRLHNTRASALELKTINTKQEENVTPRRRRESFDSTPGRIGLTAETESSRARRLAAQGSTRGSQQSLNESDNAVTRKPNNNRSRLSSKEGWRGSHPSLEGSGDGCLLPSRETKTSILRREAAVRAAANQRQNENGGSRSQRGDSRSNWRGSQQSLNEGRSSNRSMKDSRSGWRSSQPSLFDSDSNKLTVSRRTSSAEYDNDTKSGDLSNKKGPRERRGSNSSDNTDTSSVRGGSHTVKRSRENWRGSSQSLVGDSEPNNRTRRAGSSRPVNTTNNFRQQQSSNEDRINPRRITRPQSGSQMSHNNDNNDTNISRTRLSVRSPSSHIHPQSQSSDTGHISCSGNNNSVDQEALSEKDYREVLRKLSRSRTNLVTNNR